MISELSGAPGSDADDLMVPDLSEGILRELFSAATSVLKLEPWKQLHDTDWFGIRDPDSGETHVVAVMGAIRQFFAVNVYLPEEGIRFWNEFIRTGVPDNNLGMRRMRMVSCEFVSWNEEDMDETDMDREECYGDDDLDVDDLNSFLFRSTLPGCVNWHPDGSEAAKILDALRLLPVFLIQTAFLSMKCGEADFSHILPKIPVFELMENGDRSNPADWEINIEGFPQAAPEPDFLPDELFTARVAGFEVKVGESWEIASDYVETPVVRNGRPTWMTATLVASLNSGMAFGTTLHPVAAPRENALRKSFLAAAEAAGYVPETVRVRSEVAARTFKDLPGVTVRREKKLPLFDKISGHILDEMNQGPENHPFAGISPEAVAAFQEILSRHPAPEEMTPAEMKAMKDELMKIEGAGLLLGYLAGQTGEEDRHLPPPAPSKDRYIFRIELENFKEPIWRQLSIAADATFSDLHYAIQSLYGWDGWHCHCFQIRKGRRIESSIGPDELDDLPEYETPLSEIFKRKGSKIHYVYDFGDNWTHLVTQEGKVRAKKGETGPICLGGERIGPPEDCGGIWGFDALLDPENDPADDDDEGYDPAFLKHLREGKFSPEDVKF